VNDPHDLIQKYLNDTLNSAEQVELDRLLVIDPAVADALAQASALDVALAEQFVAAGQAVRSGTIADRAVQALHGGDDYVPLLPTRRRFVPAIAISFTVAMLMIVVGWRYFHPAVSPVRNWSAELLAGRVLVDGESDRPIREGSKVHVVEMARIRLNDDSEVTLLPDSDVVFQGSVGNVRQVVSLTQGSGIFRVNMGDRQFRVDTPVGRVAVVGTEFEVKLQEFPTFEGDAEMVKRSILTLAVLVSTGVVEVEVAGRSYSLTAGQGQVFADDKPAKGEGESPRKPDVTGRLLNYDADKGTLSITGKEGMGTVTFVVAPDVKLISDKKDLKLGDIGQNTILGLTLSDDKTMILAVRVGTGGEGRAVRLWLTEVDPVKKTATFKGEGAPQTFDLGKETRIFVDGNPAKLEDVKVNDKGTITFVTFDGDKKIAVMKIGAPRDGDAEVGQRERKPDVNGRIGEVDAKTHILKFMKASDGDPTAVTFNVDKEVKVIVDGKLGNVSSIQPNTYAGLMLSEDKTTVTMIRIDNKPDRRMIQAVDTDKRTVQFRAEGRELIFPVDKDVKVTIDGKSASLGDIKPDSPAAVNMSVDRKTVMAITIGRGGRGDAPREGDKKREGEK